MTGAAACHPVEMAECGYATVEIVENYESLTSDQNPTKRDVTCSLKPSDQRERTTISVRQHSPGRGDCSR